MEDLAKPSGVTLRQHIENVLAEGNDIRTCSPLTFEKYQRITKKDLSKRLNGAIKHHDDGKKHPIWQESCRKDYNAFLEWEKIHGRNYNDFERAHKNLVGKNLRNTGIRHEINSLVVHKHSNFSDPVKVAIAAHHSKLSRKQEIRWIDRSSGEHSDIIWAEFINLNACFRNYHEFKKAVLLHYEYAGVRALLQLSDRRASARESSDIPIPFKSFSYNFPDTWLKRNVQKIAQEHYDDELLLLRAPTGAGKTDASLLWASLQIQNKKAERLIIAMPTRFTSNALSINVLESLSSTGLYHSSAWFNKFHREVKVGNIEKKEARKEHEIARQLLAPVTVCTIDHLLMALTLTREDHHSIVFNLANSCVVIDEADFYDEFTQANILVLLEALKVLQVPVMIMSASLPESAIQMYKSTGYKLDSIREDKSDNERIRCEILDIVKYSELDEIEEILEKIMLSESGIIYANTVDKAIKFYSWFKKRGIEAILYHSRFTEPHKTQKEKDLLVALGKEAWAKGSAKGIAILTQIGEMSVNISADIMISEVCPIDRLVQRAGRLCRFDKSKIGELYLLIPIKDDKIYPAPYGRYVPKHGWEANQSLVKTIELLEIKKYSANDFIGLINKIYQKFDNFTIKAKDNANRLKEKFTSNWIILPQELSMEDDSESNDWKSRDISGNETIFINLPEENFYYWQDFQEFKLENSIDLPGYLVKKALKDGRIKSLSIKVDDDTMNIYYTINSYSSETGLVLVGNEDAFL